MKIIHIRYVFLSTIQIETMHTEVHIDFSPGLLWRHSVRFCLCCQLYLVHFNPIRNSPWDAGGSCKWVLLWPQLKDTACDPAALLAKADLLNILSKLYPTSILFSFQNQIKFFCRQPKKPNQYRSWCPWMDFRQNILGKWVIIKIGYWMKWSKGL